MVVRGRWALVLLIVLGLSLAANMFMFGVAASIRHFGPPGVAGMERSEGSRAMPREARRYLRSELRERRSEFRAARRALRQSRDAVGEAGRAEPFDRQALRAALQVHTERQDDLREIFLDALSDAVAEMPPELRSRLELEKFRPGPPGRRGGPDRQDREGHRGDGPPGDRAPPPPIE
jgi:uncharacterized membrane protein